MSKIKKTIKPYKDSKPMTLNEFAKYLVLDKGECAIYWNDFKYHNLESLNEATIVEIDRLISKHLERLNTFLNGEKLKNKVFNRLN